MSAFIGILDHLKSFRFSKFQAGWLQIFKKTSQNIESNLPSGIIEIILMETMKGILLGLLTVLVIPLGLAMSLSL